MEDQPADSGDLTTDSPDTPAADATKPRRGWFGRRRKAKAVAAATAAPDAEQADEPAERPTPVGKASRTARGKHRAQATTGEQPAAPATESPSESASEQRDDDSARDATSEAGTEPDTESEGTEPEGTEPEGAAPAPILVPHRPAGKRLRMAAVAAGVIFVAAAAFAGAVLQPYLSDRAVVHIKLDVARTAADAIRTLWTYTPDDMDTLPERSAAFLGGDFADEYRRYIDAIVATNQQAQVTNTTEVMGAAVETLTPSEATAIVYTNSVATSPMSKNIPSLRYLSYRLTMERRDADWLITRMSTVTSLDLTPQL